MAKIKFADEIENITTRKEFPLTKAQEVLKDEVVAVLGYGVQGPAQSLNMRDRPAQERQEGQLLAACHPGRLGPRQDPLRD